jgi:hypothetical protein
MKTMEKMMTVLAVAGLVLALAPAAQAATITYLGSDETTHDAWRSTNVVKAINGPSGADPNGDNAYGSDGYYTFTDPAGLVSDLSLSYIASVTPAGNTYSGAAYADIDDPTATIAGTVADVNAGVFYGISGTAFTFKLAEDSHFVLTIILGGSWDQNRPTGLSLTQTAGGGPLTVAATPPFPTAAAANPEVDYLFYEIDGSANDEFAIVPTGTPINAEAFSGLAFEEIHPPAGTVFIFR